MRGLWIVLVCLFEMLGSQVKERLGIGEDRESGP
jgi:hypothetical protein